MPTNTEHRTEKKRNDYATNQARVSSDDDDNLAHAAFFVSHSVARSLIPLFALPICSVDGFLLSFLFVCTKELPMLLTLTRIQYTPTSNGTSSVSFCRLVFLFFVMFVVVFSSLARSVVHSLISRCSRFRRRRHRIFYRQIIQMENLTPPQCVKKETVCYHHHCRRRFRCKRARELCVNGSNDGEHSMLAFLPMPFYCCFALYRHIYLGLADIFPAKIYFRIFFFISFFFTRCQ